MEKCVPIIILMYIVYSNRNKYTHTRYNNMFFIYLNLFKPYNLTDNVNSFICRMIFILF